MKHFRFLLTVLLTLMLWPTTVVAQSPIHGSKWTARCYVGDEPDGWTSEDFDERSWTLVTGPLSASDLNGSTMYFRQWVYVTQEQIDKGEMYSLLSFNGNVRLYANGYQIVGVGGGASSYRTNGISHYFHPGYNLVAARYTDNSDGFDFRIYPYEGASPLAGVGLSYPSSPELTLSESRLTLYDTQNSTYRTARLGTLLQTPTGLKQEAISWSTNAPDVATVEDGLVTAVASGHAVITASVTVDGVETTAQCNVEVVGFAADRKVVMLDKAGTLGDYLTQDEIEDLTNLTVFGPLNGTDVRIIRAMAGRDHNENATGYSLEDLDLTNAHIVSGGERYNKNYSTQEGVINYEMFQSCTALRKITLPKMLRGVYSTAFSGCTRLHEVNFPADCGITYIGDYAFYNTALTSIDIPRSVTNIEGWAFQSCSQLAEVHFPEDIELSEIKYGLFGYCTSLQSIEIPASVKIINSEAFYNSGLRSVTFAEGTQLESIGSSAFYSCQNLQSITIPESCTSIGENAFYNCRGLREVSLPSRLRALSPGIFRDCDALTSFTVPAGIRVVGASAFYGCDNLNTVIFPEGTQVREMGGQVFCNSLGLKHIFMMAAEPPSIEDNTFAGLNDVSIYVSEAALNKYNSNDKWGKLGVKVFEDRPTLTFAEASVTLVGGTLDASLAERQLQLNIVNPLDVAITTTWSSSAPDVVSVSQEGVVKAVAEGKATIFARVLYKGVEYTAECEVECLMFDADKTVVYVERPGTLGSLLSDEQRQNLTEITVAGNLNEYDVNVLRGEMPRLERIELINSTEYFSYDRCVYRTSDKRLMAVPRGYQGVFTTPDFMTTLPSYAFNNGVSGVTGLVLAEELTRIESWAFQSLDDSQFASVLILNPEPISVDWYTLQQLANRANYPFIVPAGALRAYQNTNWGNYCSTLTEAVDQTVFRINEKDVRLYATGRDENMQRALTIFAMVPPATLITPQVEWSTDAPTICEVDDNGLVTMKSAGQATITATATIDGQVYTSTCLVICTAPAEGETLVFVETVGTLRDQLTQRQIEDLTQLTVVGNLNGTDIQLLREMAGYDGNNLTGFSLQKLDLSGANLEGNSLGWNSFQHAIELRKIVLPASIESIDGYTFSECTGLHTVEFTGNRLSYIGNYSFRSTAIPEIDIPASVETIDSYAFSQCRNLKKVNIATDSRLKTIGYDAFYYSALETFDVPASVTEIGSSAFRYAPLKEITFAEDSKLQSIGSTAFGNTSLTEISIPDACTVVGNNCFEYCRQLTSFHLPTALKTIGNQMFYDCDALAEVTIPAGIRLIGSSAFYNCGNLTTVVFPEGTEIRNIGENAFSENYQLQHLFVMRQDPPACHENAFRNAHPLVYVPAEAVETYKANEFWSQFDFSTFDGEPVITLDNNEIALYGGTIIEGANCQQLTASVFDPFATSADASISWSSADATIASVSADGIVEAVGNGTTTITATLTYGEKQVTADCQVKSTVFEGTTPIIYIKEAGTLSQLLTEEQKNTLHELTIVGNLNSYDLGMLQQMSLLESVSAIDVAGFTSEGGVLYGTRNAEICIPKAYQGILEFPDFVTRIPSYVFNHGVTGVTGIVLGENITRIDEWAFQSLDDSKIQSIAILNPEPIDVDWYTLDQLNTQAYPVLVPKGSLEAYQNSNWSRFSQMMETVENTTFRINQSEVALYQTTDEATSHQQLTVFAMTPTSIVSPVVQWRSLNEDVAVVTEEGEVVMTGAGQTTIVATATIEGQEYKAETTVNCYAPSGDEMYFYVKEAGTLRDMIPNSKLATITNLTLFGQINADDVQTLRIMAGRDEEENEIEGSLRYLDLSQVQVVGGGRYRTLWGWNEGSDTNSFYDGVFAECNVLETVVLPQSVTSMSNYAFYCCRNLKSVTLPRSLTRLGEQMFYGCQSLEEFEIPATITSMNSNVFNACVQLKRVTFAPSCRLTNIASSAFYGCTNLAEVTLPASLASIGDNAFGTCSALTSINIPTTVTTIGQNAFQNSGLTAVNIPDDSKLTTIGTNAFSGTHIKTFYVPADLRSITAARVNNDYLECITAHENNANYFDEDGVLYSKRDNSIVLMPHGMTGVFRTPEFLTTISAGAFNGCTKLGAIVFGENVASIAENVFGDCNSLNALFSLNSEVIGATATAFDGLDKEYTSVFVPAGSLEAYKQSAWGVFENIYEFSTEPQLWIAQKDLLLYDTQLESARARQLKAMAINADGPADVEVEWSVEDPDVVTVSADGLVEVVRAGHTFVTVQAIVGGQTLTAKCSVTVYGAEDGIDLLYVERPGTVNEMLTSSDRHRITDLVVIGNVNSNDLSVIGDMARSYNGHLRSLDLSQVSLVNGTIGWGTFENNTDLVKIVLPEDVTYIDGYAFRNTRIEEVVLPASLKHLGHYAFGDNGNLKSVTISDNVELEGGALGWSASEHLLTMNVRVMDIEHDLAGLFDGIDNRTTINYLASGQPMTAFSIPEGTRRIGARRFYGAHSLTTLTIPASVEEIGDRAFEGIAEVRFLGTTPAALASSDGFTAMGTYVVPAAALATYRAADKWHDFCQQIVPDNAQLAFDLTVTADRDRSAVVAAAGGEAQIEYATRLTLHGSINSYDIFAIRTKMPNLHFLDLTDVEIIGNPYEYYTGCYTEDHRLGRRAFVDMAKLVEIHLPKHITEIGEAAFAGCFNLRTIEMHEGIETVGSSAFVACRSMKRFDFPDGIKSFGSYVFTGCTALEEINFGKGLLRVDGYLCYPWYWEEGRDWNGTLNNLHTVRFPESTEYIGSQAFRECYNLKNVLLPKALKCIEYETFGYCRSLETIVLPNGLQSIGSYAFRECTNLRELRLPPMLEYINDYAFLGCNNIADVYTYVVVPKDIAINQNTFTLKAYDQAQLHVPDFSRYAYMWDTQWGQFHDMTEFTDTYDTFYAKNTLTLDGSTGTIPGTPDATVHPTGGIEVSDDVNLDLGEVDLNHNGTDGGSIIPDHEGNVSIKHLNVKIDIEANRWYFFCFPFNVPLDDVKYGGEYVWRQYDGAARSRHEGGWRDLPADATELIAGRGYIFQGTNSSVLHLNIHNPEIRCGNASTDLNEYVGADTQPADANWNFVGNPYTSYYAVDEATYSAPITIWTGHGYEAYRPGDDDYEFAPYQAFFVQSGNGKNAVNFSADNREGYEQAQETKSNRRMARGQKKVNPNRLLVNLELGVQGEDEYIDKTRVVFNDNCSLDYESDCDAAKFFSEERRAELYTIGADGTQYAINERPEEGGYVELGFVANQKGKYTISAQRMDVPMLLVDDVMETTFDLSMGGAYEFSSAKGTFNKRFYLKRFEGITTTIKDLADKIGMTFSITDGSISVEGLDAATRVSLYNTAGQQIATQQGNGTLSAIPGAYVISVGKLAAKVVIK